MQRAVSLNERNSDKTTRFHLARADQFVVFELSQLSSQCQVRVHQESLSATLVEVLERQSCEEVLKCYNAKVV